MIYTIIIPRRPDDEIVPAVAVNITAGNRIAKPVICIFAHRLPDGFILNSGRRAQVNIRCPDIMVFAIIIPRCSDDHIVPAVAVDITAGNRVAKPVICIFARRLPDGFVLNSGRCAQVNIRHPGTIIIAIIIPIRSDDYVIKAVTVNITTGDRVAKIVICIFARRLPDGFVLNSGRRAQVNIRRPGIKIIAIIIPIRSDDHIVPAVAVNITTGDRVAKIVICIFAYRLPDGFVLNSGRRAQVSIYCPGIMIIAIIILIRPDDEIVSAVAVDITTGNRIAKTVICIFARYLQGSAAEQGIDY